jgi:hypothetical protein
MYVNANLVLQIKSAFVLAGLVGVVSRDFLYNLFWCISAVIRC